MQRNHKTDKKSNVQRNNHKTDPKKQHAKKQPQNRREKKQYFPYTQSINAIKCKLNRPKTTTQQYFPSTQSMNTEVKQTKKSVPL